MKTLFYTLIISLFAVTANAQNVVTYSNLAPSRSLIVSFHDKATVRDSLPEASKYYLRLSNVQDNQPYVEKFKFPFTWVGMELFLHIDNAASGYRVFVNDRQVGHYVNGKSHAEFDITAYAREGMNTLRLEKEGADPLMSSQAVDRKSEGMVFLTAEPKVRIRDYMVDTKLTDNGANGALDLGVILKSHFINPKQITVFCDLYTPDGKLITTLKHEADFKRRSEDTVHFTHLVTDVMAWSAENPELYRAVLSVKYEGHMTQFMRLNFGFRDVKIVDRKLLVNGKPIVIKGVILPETSVFGAVSPDSIIRKNLLTIKATGVNALRPLSHPFSSRFYDMCDDLGFYVIDMAAINGDNSHPIADNPQFTDAVVQRVASMYDNSRNHPSVIGFAMGAAAANGFNMYEANLALKQKETLRPIVYGDAAFDWNTDIYFGNSLPQQSDRPVVVSQLVYSPEAMMIFSKEGVQGGFVSNYDKNTTELAELFVPIRLTVKDLRRGDFLVMNRFDYINLNAYKVMYRVVSGDKTVVSGEVVFAAKPGETAALAIPISDLKMRKNKAYSLEINFVPKSGAKLTSYQKVYKLN